MYGYYPNNNYPNNNYVNYNQSTDERIWVQNQSAAEAYLMAPNSFVRLWDANQPIFYEKRSDATGRPLPLETYEYSKRKPIEASFDNGKAIDYKNELEALQRRVEALERGRNESVSESNNDDAKV